MSKYGNHSTTSGHHGREGWKQWQKDNDKALAKSTIVRRWIPVMVTRVESPNTSEEENLLSTPDDFKSYISELRPHPGSSWGYLFVPRISGQQDAPAPKNVAIGRPPDRLPDRQLYNSDPDIDAGAAALIRLPKGNTQIAIPDLDEADDPYSILLSDCGKILQTYDYLYKKGGFPAKDVRKPKAKGAVDNLRRKTIDVSPGISRAIEFMIKDGKAEDARKILADLQKTLAVEMEQAFPASKVVACGWHCNSGKPDKPGILHLDTWMHSTQPTYAVLGAKRTRTLIRTWTAGGLDHGGPGPGICAWDRHMAALGEEMEKLAPGRCLEVRNAIKRQEQRAKMRKRPGTANRDIWLHRRFDELVAGAIPPDYLKKGMDAYKTHLRQVYADGDPKVATTVEDPKKLARKKRQLERSMLRLRRREKRLVAREARLLAAIETDQPDLREIRLAAWRKSLERKKKSRRVGKDIGRRMAILRLEETELRNEATRLEQDFAILDSHHGNFKCAEIELQRKEQDFEQKAKGLVEDATLDGLRTARKSVLGASAPAPKASTAIELAREFVAEIKQDVRSQVVSGLKAALEFLFPGHKTEGREVEEIQIEIKETIRKSIVTRFDKFFKALGYNRQSEVITPEVLDVELNFVANKFKERGVVSGLELAHRELIGPDAPIAEKLDEATLREGIRKDAAKLRDGLAALETRQQEADARQIELDRLKNEIETERNRMKPITVRELCVKLGFAVDDDESISAKLPHYEIKNDDCEYRGSLKGEIFELKVLQRIKDGHYDWVDLKHSPGIGAIQFMQALMKISNPAEACTKLAAMFPERDGGILLEILSKHDDQSWINVFQRRQQPKTQAPQIAPDSTRQDIDIP